MIKNLFIFVLILFSSPIFSAEFIASVTNNQVNLGQSLTLTLSLTDARTKDTPNLSVLSKDFNIYSQQQYSSYSATNGTINEQFGWEIALLPNKEGQLLIPALEINTNKGKLRTKELYITVAPATVSNTNNAIDQDNTGISIVSSTNKIKVYVKEPIVYTLKLIAYKPIVNLMLDDIKSTDAIIDKIGEPKQYMQTVGGIRASVIEVKYHVTPIVPGNIEITPAVVRGEIQIPVQAQNRPSHSLGLFDSMFFDNRMTLQPFSAKGDKITISASAPPIKDKNWLPLQNLELSEEWEGLNSVKVGDTLIRKINIKASGTYSNQIPSLKDYIDQKNIKIYTDKPTLKDQIKDNDSVIGTKQETYSIVPQQAGKLHFPEIKISWWNLRTNKPEVSVLPAKNIEVLAAVKNPANNTTIDYSVSDEPAVATHEGGELKAKFWDRIKENSLILTLISTLIVVIISMLAVIIYLLKLKTTTSIKAESKLSPSINKSMSEIRTAIDLRNYIMKYASSHWHAPENLSFTNLGSFLTQNNYSYELDSYLELSKNLNNSIYSAKSADLDLLLELWSKFKESIARLKVQKQSQTPKDSDYLNLNPT